MAGTRLHKARWRRSRTFASRLAALECYPAAPDGCYIAPTAYNVFWVFVLTSIAGLAVETLVSFPLDGVWKDRAGLVWGPFSPIYGAGAVLMTLLLNNMKDRSGLRLFLKAAVIGGLFELFAGFLMEHMYGMVAWDYADRPLNLGGYTCLEIAVVWGVMGYVWMRLLLVPVAKLAECVPKGYGRTVLTATTAAFLAVDVAMTFASASFWFDRMAGLPVETPVQQYFAEHYSDAFMDGKFQTISMYPELASR